MADNSVALSEDPNYKQTVANTIKLLREIRAHVDKGGTRDAIYKLDFARDESTYRQMPHFLSRLTYK